MIVSGAVLIIAMLRANREDIPKIIDTLCGSRDVAILGWLVAFIVLAAAVVLIMILCKIHDREIERIANERDQLQAKLLERSGGQT